MIGVNPGQFMYFNANDQNSPNNIQMNQLVQQLQQIFFKSDSMSLGREHDSHLVILAAVLCYRYQNQVFAVVFVQTSTLS